MVCIGVRPVGKSGRKAAVPQVLGAETGPLFVANTNLPLEIEFPLLKVNF